MKLFKEIKGVFKQPTKRFYFGAIAYGTPYFGPWNFNSQILTFRKERPKFLRCKYFSFLGYQISYGWPVYVYWHSLGWKDKYSSPRWEWSPSFYIFFFKWQFCIFWNAPDGDNDLYYEMILWWKHYCDKDIKKAEQSWGWIDSQTRKSTWNPDYVL